MKPIKALILEYLSHHEGERIKVRSLSKKLGIPKSQRQEFEDTFEAILQQRATSKKSSKKPVSEAEARDRPRGLISGIIRKTAAGAWFTPHPQRGSADRYTSNRSQADVFIYPEDLRDAHDGDEVLLRVHSKRGGSGRRLGKVEEVIGRQTNVFVGTYFEDYGQGYVRVDGAAFTSPVPVGDPGAKGADPGDKVVIEMVQFPTRSRPGEAVISELLGSRGEPGVDTKAIIREFGLPVEFTPEALAEARERALEFDESKLGDRLDLTQETIVTIDPVDARDFDDAISLRRSEDGHWHLGVHIADVSHFVQAGGVLDAEACQRGTSVYLPGRVIPMLPEVISNALASLQAGRVRFTKSVLIEFLPDGLPIHTEFHNSAIKVTRRFAYEEVMPIVRDPQSAGQKIEPQVVDLLKLMHELAMTLRQRRFQQGAIELYLPEVKIKLDHDGAVSGAAEAAHDESHQIIEEFMLAANIAVATCLTDLGIHFLRRVHASPDGMKLRGFADFIGSLGFPLKQYEDRYALQSLLDRVKGKPFEQAVNFALLRSMRQAEYTGGEDGHYALAVENYCHFTSPIRRYPDLTVHRLIDTVIRRKGKLKKIGLTAGENQKLGQHCSFTERRAAQAERELTRVKLLTLLATMKQETFDAVITGIEKFGLFARCQQYPVDGFIPIEQLAKNGTFDYDRTTRTLTARRSGAVFQLGDSLRVRIATIDPDARVLNWSLAEQEPVVIKKRGSKRRDETPKPPRAKRASKRKQR